MDKFKIILADPPWPYFEHNDKRQKFVNEHYQTMTAEQINELPINDYLASDGICFVWATYPKLDLAIDAIRSWELHYRGVAHTWIKTTIDGRPLNGSGPRATYSKPTIELLLFASKKKKGRPLKLMVENLPCQVMHKRLKHSQKPQVFHEFIDAAYPYISQDEKLEIFARRYTYGWSCTGLELTGHDYTKGKLI